MILNTGEDRLSLALAHLTGSMGLYWVLYDARGQRLRAALPRTVPPCTDEKGCPLVSSCGACRGASISSMRTDEPQVLIACHADPARPPAENVTLALVGAFQSHHRAEDEVEATVRELTATYQELSVAYRMMETINASGSREALGQALLSQVLAAVPGPAACLLQLDEAGEIEQLAGAGISALDAASLWQDLNQRPADAGESEHPRLASLPHGRALVAGMPRHGAWVGLLAVVRPLTDPFSSREAKLLQAVAHQASLALRNRGLVDDVHGMFIGTIHALVAAIEVKDAYTCGHSRRVAQAARETARLIGLADDAVEEVYMAGIVHDIGKIAVEKAILQKPGRLTEEEWEVVRTHPDQGAGIIASVRQLEHLAAGVRHHHERCDGGGYPLGLHDEEIPLESRIIAVCDTYDAMTSARSYRPALSHEEALRELGASAGRQLNKAVVEAFLHTVAV